ncbi:hypothetical protein ACOSQ3_009599 [Xanthoceras sorbifolium]
MLAKGKQKVGVEMEKGFDENRLVSVGSESSFVEVACPDSDNFAENVVGGAIAGGLGVKRLECPHVEDCWKRVVAFVQNYDSTCVNSSSPAGFSYVCRSTGFAFGFRFVGWKVPLTRKFKLNVDAARDKNSGRFGLGMMVRQEGGDVVLAAALSLKEALLWLWQRLEQCWKGWCWLAVGVFALC